MVGVDGAHDGRRLRGRVAVAAVRVVDERHLDRGVVGRPRAPGLVGAPLRSRDDRRLRGHRGRRRRQVDAGDGGRGPAHDADEGGGRVGVLGAVDGDDAHVAQARRCGAGARRPRGDLHVAAGAGPDRLGERLLPAAVLGRPLERDLVPAAPRAAVLTGAQQHEDGTLAGRRLAGDRRQGEAHARVHGDRPGDRAGPRAARGPRGGVRRRRCRLQAQGRRERCGTQLHRRRADPRARARADPRSGPHGGQSAQQAQGAGKREMRGSAVGVRCRHGPYRLTRGFDSLPRIPQPACAGARSGARSPVRATGGGAIAPPPVAVPRAAPYPARPRRGRQRCAASTICAVLAGLATSSSFSALMQLQMGL